MQDTEVSSHCASLAGRDGPAKHIPLHCRRRVQNKDSPSTTSDTVRCTEMKGLAQDCKKSLADVGVGFRLVPTPALNREEPSSLRLASSHFGFADFKANAFGN